MTPAHFWPDSATARWPPSSPRAMPGDIRRFTPLRLTASTPRFLDLHDLHRLQYFDHADEGRVRDGALFTSRMGTSPT